MFDFLKKSDVEINTTEIINTIENNVYSKLKPFGFRKYGRTLHRFVDNDISQVINFQCGQAYRDETHLMWVNIGIRISECVLREFHSDEVLKKYYHEYECNIRSRLGTVKNEEESCYDLRGNIENIIDDISEQIRQYVLPVFEVLNSRGAILRERKNYPNFDTMNHLIVLEEAMIYGKMGNMDMATARYQQYYKNCLCAENPHRAHIEYLRGLAEKLESSLEN
ncbi:MAG: DUF4304 domain-containing protein [Clostridia bacterium]|nr:DUF4304 domain-containing protein [Clostridia bacterium]